MNSIDASRYGFEWGPATIERTGILPNGSHILTVKTQRRQITVYITPTGLMRVFSASQEWTRTGETSIRPARKAPRAATPE